MNFEEIILKETGYISENASLESLIKDMENGGQLQMSLSVYGSHTIWIDIDNFIGNWGPENYRVKFPKTGNINMIELSKEKIAAESLRKYFESLRHCDDLFSSLKNNIEFQRGYATGYIAALEDNNNIQEQMRNE